MSVCDRTCMGCAYSSVTSMWGISCNYILVTGHRRGCPAGAKCTKRLTGSRMLTVDQLILMPRLAEKHRERKALSKEEKSAQRRRSEAKSRERLAGRQRAVLIGYRDEHHLTNTKMAEMAGVKRKTLESWMTELCRAKWDKLAPLGIQKPEGI